MQKSETEMCFRNSANYSDGRKSGRFE